MTPPRVECFRDPRAVPQASGNPPLDDQIGRRHRAVTVRCRSNRASQASDESPLGFALRSSQFFNCFARGWTRSLVIESESRGFQDAAGGVQFSLPHLCVASAFSMTRCRSSWHSAMYAALNALRDATASLACVRERCQCMARDVAGNIIITPHRHECCIAINPMSEACA